MTKQITTLLLVLMCSFSSMLAQKVASQATAVDAITDGYYMIVVHSKKSNTNGNLVYCDGKNVRVEHKSKNIDSKIGKVILDNESDKYIWKVTKSGSSMSIMSYSNNKYWNRYENWGFVWDNESIVDRDNLSVGNSQNTYTIEKNRDYIHLSIDNRYSTAASRKKTVYIIDCRDENSSDDANLGYRRTPGDEIAEFSFYAVEMPKDITITYNLFENGEYTTSKQVDAKTYRAFPVLSTSDFATLSTPLPIYVSPTDNTIDLNYNVALPFETGKLYYLQGNASTDSRQTINGSLSVHATSEQPALNDISADLWRVEGNVFDGFRFLNVSTDKYLTYNEGGLFSRASVSMSDNGTLWIIRDNQSKRDESAITDEFGKAHGFALTAVSGASLDSKNFVTVNSTIEIGAANNMGTLYLADPTLAIKLNYSAADEATFATSCLPYNVVVAEGDAKAYYGTYNADNTRLEMNEVQTVAANQGFILRSESAQNNVVLRIVDTADTQANDLKGTTEGLTDMTNVLSFGRLNGNGKVGFFRSTNDHLSANRAYVVSNSAANAVAMIFGGTTTGIDAINSNATNSATPIYDLSGRRVKAMVKGGVYIQNGKKYIAK